MDNDVSDNDDPTTRVIKYHLGPDFLKLSTVGLTLNFGIGEKEVKNMEKNCKSAKTSAGSNLPRNFPAESTVVA